jgi:hypothetical protein
MEGIHPEMPFFIPRKEAFLLKASRARPVSGHGQVRESVENGGGRPFALRGVYRTGLLIPLPYEVLTSGCSPSIVFLNEEVNY